MRMLGGLLVSPNNAIMKGSHETSRMVSRKMIAAFLCFYVVAMLAKQSEGYIALYNPEDFRRMLEKEKNQAQKKSLQERSDMGNFPRASGDEEQIIKLIAPVEIRIHLNARQQEKYQGILKEFITEMSPDIENVN